MLNFDVEGVKGSEAGTCIWSHVDIFASYQYELQQAGGPLLTIEMQFLCSTGSYMQ